jgi:hypothetical protein
MNGVLRSVVLIRGRSSSYAGVRCRTWAGVFAFIHGHVVSICGRPFLYAGVSLSGEGSCLRTWAVIIGSYDVGGVSWSRQQAIVEQLGLVTWHCHVGVIVRVR